jgi:hypothetical protein
MSFSLRATLLAAFCLAASSFVHAEDPLKNAGFDHGLHAWRWSGATNGTVLTQAALDGSNVFQVVPADNTADVPPPWHLNQTVAGLTPGTAYRLGVWTSAEQNAQSRLLAGDQTAALPAGSHEWTLTQIEFTAPDDGSPVSIGVDIDTPAKRLWLANFSLTPIIDQQGEIKRLQDQNHDQLTRIETTLADHPEFDSDAYIRMRLAIALRYLARVDTSGPGGTQGMSNIKPNAPEVARWNFLQARENASVLALLANRLDALVAGRQPAWTQPSLAGQSIETDAGGFVTRSADGSTRPVVLGGYGHFSPVMDDAAFLHELGVNLVQQERGPRELRPDGKISGQAQTLLDQLAASAPGGRKIDVLLSPHYMPAELFKKYPDLAGNEGGGFMKFNIDHPAARKAIADWITTFVPLASGRANLFAFCLSNEPGYVGSGRDVYSRPRWIAWLQARHHNDLAALNALYGTSYAAFEDVPVPPVAFPSEATDLPAYYDWVVFNQKNFADWHRWMNDLVKSAAPDAWTHAKLMPDIFDTRPRAQRTHSGILARGMDPELITRFTDLAGCDSWSFVMPDRDWQYTWLRTHLWYDLLNSFNHKPVFDSELHAIIDRHPAESLPSGHVYTVLWQGALHHRTAYTSWVWSEPGGHSSLGSIYMRPADVEEAVRAQLDLNRLAPEIDAINATPARVALLYSPASLFWQEDYPGSVKDLYTLLTQLGHKITFVSERQLAAGEVSGDIRCVFLPRATHVEDTTRDALQTLAASGVAILPVGRENLAFNTYNQPADAAWLPKSWRMGLNRQVDLDHFSAVLLEKLGADQSPAVLLNADSGEIAWGVEYRDLTANGRRLIALTNLSRETLHLKLAAGGNVSATDLIGGQSIDLAGFYLRPLQPVLLSLPLTR